MTFNSVAFLIFYPLVLLLYYLLPRKMRWPMLLFASYFFYMYTQPELVVLILFTTLVSWVSARVMEGSQRAAVRRLALTLTLLSSLGVLFFYKYFNFISQSLAGMLNTDPVLLNLILPVGISFYTFQTLSYVIDVYRGSIKTERNFFFYALFVSFFPQLVAGPIERPQNLLPQLKEHHTWDNARAVKGAKHMLVGFFKKICVADLIAPVVESVYGAPDGATSLAVVIATALFAVQIYCDFSGYTDIAIGCAEVMGIRLMKNFDHPYMATTIKEFWSRWHISLSTWFKDYLYIPLGGSRVGRARHLLNLFIVFIVSGLWHGAAWTFVAWGAIHGVYQIIGNLTAKPRKALVERLGHKETDASVRIVRRVITFVLVSFAWLFFRASSLSDAGRLLSRLFAFEGGLSVTLSSMGLSLVKILLIIVSMATLTVIDRLLTYGDEPDGSDILVRRGAFVYLVWIVLLFWLLLLSKDMVSTFIYFQF